MDSIITFINIDNSILLHDCALYIIKKFFLLSIVDTIELPINHALHHNDTKWLVCKNKLVMSVNGNTISLVGSVDVDRLLIRSHHNKWMTLDGWGLVIFTGYIHPKPSRKLIQTISNIQTHLV